MARGHWRIDHVALASLGPAMEPIRVDPLKVEAMAAAPSSPNPLAGSASYLVTQRGDEYRLTYDLGEVPGDAELFLETQGYYYEWMREEWTAEENPMLAGLILSNPGRALQVLAPAFKEREAEMEALFWASRFRREP
jgi:hypothetical protein